MGYGTDSGGFNMITTKTETKWTSVTRSYMSLYKKDIIKLIENYLGRELAKNNTVVDVEFHAPGGGDYSNESIDLENHPVTVTITTTEYTKDEF